MSNKILTLINQHLFFTKVEIIIILFDRIFVAFSKDIRFNIQFMNALANFFTLGGKWGQHSYWMMEWESSILHPKHQLSGADPESYINLHETPLDTNHKGGRLRVPDAV